MKTLKLDKVVAFAKAYAALDYAAQARMDDVLDGRPDDCVPSALRAVRRVFETIADPTADGGAAEEAGDVLVEIDDSLGRRG